jgi:hypothetical protein
MQPVGHPGQPASLVRIENVPPLQLNSADDQPRICRCYGISAALGSQLERAEKHRHRQKVPKMQQNSR